MMARTKVEDYRRFMERAIFNGQHIRKISHSLYRVGNENYVIAATKPEMADKDHYFFGINASFVRKASAVILVCGNHLIAFAIPSSVIRGLGLNFDKKSNNMRYLATVGTDDGTNWYITREAKSGKATKVMINKFLANLNLESA